MLKEEKTVSRVCDLCGVRQGLQCIVCGKDICTVCGDWLFGYGKITFSNLLAVCNHHTEDEKRKAIINMVLGYDGDKNLNDESKKILEYYLSK